jgi:acylglycerol lipase
VSETEGNVEEGFLDAPDGLRIGWRRWSPTGEIRGVVVVLHGIGEHGGRYGEVATRFNDAGYVVAAMDFRGHGRSGGRRGDTRIPPSLSDIDLMLRLEAQRNSRRSLLLYGHSLGGLIAFLYALDRNPDLAGVVLTGPAFHTVLREQRVKVAVARALGSAIPGLTL